MNRLFLGACVATTVVVFLLDACGSDGAKENAGDGGSATEDVSPSLFVDSSTGCVPKTCNDLGADCGPHGDGCGNVIQCGTCVAPAFCGGGGANKCGTGTGDASVACTPKTCTDLAVGCGPQGDGCGNVIQCGDCTLPQICGGAGPSKCGGSTLGDGSTANNCVPTTCAALGKNCGPVADGCGGLLSCGACPSGAICGLKSANVCSGTLPDGGIACTPRTCAFYGATCGQLGDGCGGLTAPCGTCTSPAFCGGGGFSLCGVGDGGVGTDAGCTGLCQQIAKCDGGTTTTVTGTVWAPSGPTSAFGALPVPGATVYVPNGAVQAFGAGVSCDKCGATVSGSPLVSTTTAADGTFTLSSVPSGTNIPLVIQLGRWRRQVTIANVTSCTKQALSGDTTRLPRTKAEGDIPLIAISTGKVDALECVFRKMGVDDTEFTNSQGNGRIRIYRDNGAHPPAENSSTKRASGLYGSQTELDKFDAVIFACVGGQHDKDSDDRNRVLAYANKGGRVFATHYSYVWLYKTNPWNTTGDWNVNQDFWDSVVGLVDTTTTKGVTFQTWLGVVNALSASSPPRVAIDEARHDIDQPLASGAERWITTYNNQPKAAVEHYAFNTPWGQAPANQCGRVIYSDFHVTTNSNTDQDTFPEECNDNPLTAQEKVLAFMMFDLTTCISPPTASAGPCVPKTCVQQGYTCGQAGDGCGGVLNCGTCQNGQTCGGAGVQFKCGGSTSACVPKNCQAQGYTCGLAGDGCGGVISCGNCTPPAYCGGGGPNKCGTSGVGGCAPTTCAAKGAKCGPLGDGCGNLLSCGTCPPNQVCIGNQCQAGSCTPTTCQAAGAECGPLGDGCGALLDCGPCTNGQVCGGSGTPNKCGGGVIK
jgi:hypothetical protein